MSDVAIQKLRKMIEDADVFSFLTGKKPSGRPKGVKNSTTIEPGKTLEIATTPEQIQSAEPKVISVTEGKRLMKASRKPRNISEEQREKMLQNLKLGRERLLEKKRKLQEEKDKQTSELNKNKVIQKYIVKERKKRKTTEIVPPSEDEDDSDSETMRKIQKKEQIINKINSLQQAIKPVEQIKQKQATYNPFRRA
jgi:hypothetical protein